MTTFLQTNTQHYVLYNLFNSGDRAITMVPWRWWYLVEPQYGHQPPHSWKGYHAGVNGWCWGVNPCMQQKTNIGRHPFFLLFCRYRALLQLYRNKNCSKCLENPNIQQISIDLWKLILCMHSNKCEKCNFYTFYLIPNLKE